MTLQSNFNYYEPQNGFALGNIATYLLKGLWAKFCLDSPHSPHLYNYTYINKLITSQTHKFKKNTRRKYKTIL